MRKLLIRARKLFLCCGSGHSTLQVSTEEVDVREEYANAFRTESYNVFWTRVLTVTHRDPATRMLVGATSASRLLSYRLFVDHLLDPDQPTVTKVLALSQNQPDTKILLTDYFQATANASMLCGLLLKDIDHMRIKFRSLKKTLKALECAPTSSTILARLTEFTKSINPFVSSSTSLVRYRSVKSSCAELLKRLESRRDKVRAKLQLLNGLKYGSAIFLVALASSITLVIVTHFIAMTLAMPGFIIASLDQASMKQLAKTSAQLDAAAKGTYILNRDLDTISRIVARLDDELEHIRTMIRFWMNRVNGDHLQAQAGEQVARQLEKNDSCFTDQLDELEEHLYLCFMTINRARNLVVKELSGLNNPS